MKHSVIELNRLDTTERTIRRNYQELVTWEEIKMETGRQETQKKG